jgi:hypothetical protein
LGKHYSPGSKIIKKALVKTNISRLDPRLTLWTARFEKIRMKEGSLSGEMPLVLRTGLGGVGWLLTIADLPGIQPLFREMLHGFP